jgi:GMP reductase
MPKIKLDPQYDFKDVLIEPRRSCISSRSSVFIERRFSFRHSCKKWDGVPMIAANMDTTGTFEVYEVLAKNNIITAMNKFYKSDDYLNTNVQLHPDMFMVSTGISDTDFINLKDIMSKVTCNWICIDVANGYMDSLLKFCTKVRAAFPDKIIVAGNVVTKERVEELILYGGVDIVKIGIGPGSACTTRVKTGVGVPQFSAVMECAEAAHRVGGHIISDGGITCPGDVAKAFGGGADFVMVGGQFAGHDENPGKLIEDADGKKYKEFYGMSSTHAMEKHYGFKQNYRSSEGRHLKIPYRGALQSTVEDYLGGLRSALSYVGASRLELFEDNVTFRLVGQQFNSAFL